MPRRNSKAAYPHFFKFLPNTRTHIHTRITSRNSFCCLVSMTKWLIVPHPMCYFNQWYYRFTHAEPRYLSTNRTLRDLCKKASVNRRDVTWFFVSTLIWRHIHTQIKTHSNILTPTVMFSQQLSVLHWINNSLISKIYFKVFHNIFIFLKSSTCKRHVSVD